MFAFVRTTLLLCIWLLGWFAPQIAYGEPIAEKTMSRVADMLSGNSKILETRAKQLLSDSNYEELWDEVRQIHKQTAGARFTELDIHSDTYCLMIFGLRDRDVYVRVRLSKESAPRVVGISSKVTALDEAETAPITWANLRESLAEAAEHGFSGAVLVSRNGEIVLNEGYGYANREKKIKNTHETVFATGSSPIDFTHAGILLLKDEGQLKLDDPITKFLTDVPDDKSPITIRHLMTGRSGLPDFHELPTDKNPDHSWIDRDEAIRRIMNQRLLFEPGKGRSHSHSAWGLLAAIIEIVSGETYAEFTTKRLFEPAGMTDTGFFGDPVPEDRVAVGYGKKSSTPNSPPHWGQTSWLVMGSGGQVSTLTDMYRWKVAMRSGTILSKESTAAIVGSGNGISQDGDSFGFEFMHSSNPDQLFMIISNTVATRADRRSFDRLGRRLQALIKSRPE